ncbi:MAG: MFS transporter [Myxococcaceae bacterium]|nr:MFS transporter [Myxococcaceae bacterium]
MLAANRLVLARGLRGFVDGTVTVLFAKHLASLGHDSTEIGAVMTATLLGSAATTLALGLFGNRLPTRAVLLAGAALMFFTGLAFFAFTAFGVVLVIAVLGTLNPSTGDVSFILPTEHAALSGMADGDARVALYARYSIVGRIGVALGALAGGLLPGLVPAVGFRAGFLVAMAVAVVCLVIYLGLELPSPTEEPPKVPLQKSRDVVVKLSLYFALDSAGGGFALESLLVLWLQLRFDLPLETTGAVFFVASLLNGASQYLSVFVAKRLGLVRTMVFTHLPANVFLILAAVMPTAPLAIALLLLRACLTQMDVPARNAFVMAVVAPEERRSAASVTAVPRALASGVTPALAGLMLDTTTFGWPLVCAGVLKIAYDLLMLFSFRKVKV